MIGEFLGREAADERLGEVARCKAVEIGAHLVDKAEPDLVRRDLVVEDPVLGFRNRDGLGQEIVHLDDLDAAVAHLGDEVEMVALGVLDPEHVVEQKVVAIAGRQPLVRAARRADHHEPELADFRVNAEGRRSIRHRLCPPYSALRCVPVMEPDR